MALCVKANRWKKKKKMNKLILKEKKYVLVHPCPSV